MSKIYRRPMFRGGGKVSSYGNGITAPLVPGYQGGGQIGGGQIYGTPMGDGRYGFAQPLTLSEKLKADGLTNGVGMSTENLVLGSDLLNNNRFIKTVAPQKVNIEEDISNDNTGSKEIVSEVFDDSIQFPEDDDLNTTITKNKETGKNEYGYNEGMTLEQKNFFQGLTKPGKYVSPELEAKQKLEALGDTTSGNSVPPSQRNQAGVNSNEIDDNRGDSDLIINKPEETQISAKDAIRENQELFKELLGGKAARGQDISDMLLRFSGSEGNTLGEKFKSYTRAESAAGPGRGEKINQTAAALAINDYVAGKRSDEQSEYLTKKIDYEYKKKGELSTLNIDDDIGTALAKSAKLTGAGFKSLKNIKNIINKKTGRDDIYEGNIKIKDLDPKSFKQKKVNKLKPGYNIVEDEGVKRIVLIGNDGTNNTVISIQTITELWTGK